ncbi:putative methyltransferase [Mycobacteroides abscessus subsp. abscessus]|nr:putative methyltransferase [Mycobacteroides abscessus subsp. abscessus]
MGISVVEEYEDEGGNHYFDAVKAPADIGKG